jgi:hypothetical protein
MRYGLVSIDGAGEIRQRVVAALFSARCWTDRLMMKAGTLRFRRQAGDALMA